LDQQLFGAGLSVQNLLLVQRELPPFHQLSGEDVHSGNPPFPTGAVLAGVFDEFAGDAALRSAVDWELFEDAARGLTAGCHAPTRIGDDGRFGTLRGW